MTMKGISERVLKDVFYSRRNFIQPKSQIDMHSSFSGSFWTILRYSLTTVDEKQGLMNF